MILAAPYLPRAACTSDPDLWFATTARDRATAQRICAACPERRPCLAWATGRSEQFGVWGGLTADARRARRRRARAAAAAGAAA